MIAGSRAGTVQEIRLQGETAVATISLDAAYAPVHSDARVTLRPKSLLGEKYLALEPGRAATELPSGAVLQAGSVARSVELEELVSTFDGPTRDKLGTLVVELGGGVAGRGPQTNRAIVYGSRDLEDLAAISQTLARREQELAEVIRSLDIVLGELARSDRSRQLGDMIVNADAILRSLADQDAQLQRMLVETNAALTRSDTGLSGTGPQLNSLARQSKLLVQNTDRLTGDLGLGLDYLSPHMDQFITGIRQGPIVFGASDANGYATRIRILAGPGTVGLGPVGGSGPGSAGAGGTAGTTTGGTQPAAGGDQLGLSGFLLGVAPTP
jgi:phospholipid/cholesterol/gamma-HCH transport system substrate-binding protein